MAKELSINDKIALISSSIQALDTNATFERDEEAKKIYKKLSILIDETREKEEWAKRHSKSGDELTDIKDTFEKLQAEVNRMADIMGDSFHIIQREVTRGKSQYSSEDVSGHQSVFDMGDPVVPAGSRRSKLGKSSDFFTNLGGLVGSEKLQTLGSILSGETDLTSGKMMKVAEKLNFAGKLLGGKNTKIGAKLLKGRDFFERNKSFASDFLKERQNRSLTNPYPGGHQRMQAQAIPESFVQQEGTQAQQAQQSASGVRVNRKEQDRGYEQVGKKISGVIKKFLAPEGFDEANAKRMREMRKLTKIFGKLNKNMLKMDGALGKFMGSLKDTLGGLLKKGGGGAVQALLRYFAMGKFAKMLGGVFGKGSGLFGKVFTRGAGSLLSVFGKGSGMLMKTFARAIPMLGSAIAAAGPAIATAIAGAGALAVGGFIGHQFNKHVLQPGIDKAYNTKTGKKIIDGLDEAATKVIGKVAGTDRGITANAKKAEKHNKKLDENKDTYLRDANLNNEQRQLVYAGKLQWEHLSEEQQQKVGKENFEKYAKNQKAYMRNTGKDDEYTEMTLSEDIANASAEDIRTGKIRPIPKTPAPQLGENTQPPVKTTQAPGKSLGDIISSHEGTYDDVNRGAAHGYKSAKRDLTNMTVEQVMQLQEDRDFNAAGKPQVIRDTLKGLVAQGVIDPKAMFDEKTQNDILVHLTEKRAGGYITGRHDNINASLDDISKEWASVENPYTGRSYYDKDGVNKAHTSAADVGEGLKQARELYQQNIAAGMDHKSAMRAAVLGQRAEASAPGELKAQPQSEAAKVAALSEVQPRGDGEYRFGLKMNADGSIAQESISQNFSTQGKVNLGGMNPLFMSRANGFADEFKELTGENIVATEGQRSKAEQERLYNLYKAGKGNLAAKPGTSKHGHGLAMDMSARRMEAVLKKHPEVIKQLGAKNARDAIDKLAAKHGLHRPMKHREDEQQHFEMIKDEEYLNSINESMVAEVRNKRQSGAHMGSAYLKENAGLDDFRTDYLAQDSMNQEALASTPPIINMPPSPAAPPQQQSGGSRAGGAGPMGAGNQDQLMTFMFGAYGGPMQHIG